MTNERPRHRANLPDEPEITVEDYLEARRAAIERALEKTGDDDADVPPLP